MYGYPDQVPRGVTPTGLLTDAQLRLCGYDPVMIRRMEDELAEMGLGLGLEGIFGDIWKGVKGVAKGVAKVGKTAVKVGAPIVSTFIPGGRVVEEAVKLLPSGRKPQIAPTATISTKRPPTILQKAAQIAYRRLPRPEAQVGIRFEPSIPVPAPVLPAPPSEEPSILEKLRGLVEKHAPTVLPQIIERFAPAPTPAPVPSAPTTVVVPGAPAPVVAPAAAGAPNWLLPVAIGAVALTLLKR